mgnify:CR=1 FL=1
MGGCASTGEQNSPSMFAPTAISNIYSNVSMKVQLAFTPAVRKDYFDNPEVECAGPSAFEQRVVRIGAKLAEAAYRTFPDLSQRIPRFEFSVSDKTEPGVASTAGGLIVVLQPVSEISLSDDALAFVIARELGHVISRHHEQNTAISISFSILATALSPVLGVSRLLALVTSSSSSATAASTLTSAASYASSRAVIASYGETQRKTSDGVALRLLPKVGFDARAVSAGLAAICRKEPPTKWLLELNESVSLLPPLPSTSPDKALVATTASATTSPAVAPVE